MLPNFVRPTDKAYIRLSNEVLPNELVQYDNAIKHIHLGLSFLPKQCIEIKTALLTKFAGYKAH